MSFSHANFFHIFEFNNIVPSIQTFASWINIDRIAPKISKTEALCPIDRQSMFVNLKADEKLPQNLYFSRMFPIGIAQSFLFSSWRITGRDVMSRNDFFCGMSHDITSYYIFLYKYIDVYFSSIASIFYLPQQDFCTNKVTEEEKVIS